MVKDGDTAETMTQRLMNANGGTLGLTAASLLLGDIFLLCFTNIRGRCHTDECLT